MMSIFNRYINEDVKRHYVARLEAERLGRPEMVLRRQEVANMLHTSPQGVAYWVEKYAEDAQPEWLDKGQQFEIEGLYAAIQAKLREIQGG